MKPNLCPDYPVIVDDWLLSETVSAMSPAEEGAYFRLLCHAWRHEKCLLPDDDEKLARLSRLGADWEKSKGTIRACFESDGQGTIYNRRQLETREAQKSRVKSSRKANSVRWSKRYPNGAKPDSENPPTGDKSESEKCPNGAKSESDRSVSLTHSLTHTHSPTQRTDDAREVELPAGFPKTEKEAKAHAGFVGCTEEFAAKVWQRAMSRGGHDSKDVPVRNFRAHLATAWSYEREHMAKKPKESQTPAGKPPGWEPWHDSL